MFFNFNLAKFITFQDKDICNRVRNIDKKNITEHDNKDLNIRIIEDKQEFYSAFAIDIVSRIKAALEDNKMFIAILPVGPMPQYTIVAEMINKMKIPMHHVYTFNMDEYANEDGISAPVSWEGSFKRSMMDNFFNKIDDELRPPLDHIHFPDSDNIDDYDKMVEDLGGADVCYGGIGWCGHIAFWESHLGLDFLDNIEEYKKQRSRIVELHPMTIMQNALHSFSGDWSNVPPKAVTIGPNLILGAKLRSFWLDGYIGGGISWQRFIARLVLHGPVTPLVPGSLLQTEKSDINLLGGVADNVVIDMA
jgi:glucosamine-6-phosphate deaminase